MDLPAEAERLRLDLLAVRLSTALRAADVPHALLKGPSTSLWLYDPPRPYRDVDLLVPLSAVGMTVATLQARGLATRAAGRIGEEAAHSLMLRSREGFEIDLHISLPLVPADGDRVWRELVSHVVDLDLDVGVVPALDEPARCVVLALHALGNGLGPSQPREDLERARRQCEESAWREALALAARLEVLSLVRGAIAMVDGSAMPTHLSPRARLHASSAPSEALAMARILEARGWQRMRMLAREVIASEGFLRFDDPTIPVGRRFLLAAQLRRWRRIARRLPAGVRAYRAAR